ADRPEPPESGRGVFSVFPAQHHGRRAITHEDPPSRPVEGLYSQRWLHVDTIQEPIHALRQCVDTSDDDRVRRPGRQIVITQRERVERGRTSIREGVRFHGAETLSERGAEVQSSDVEFALTPPSEFRRTKLTQPGTHKDGDAAQIPTDIRLPYRLLDRTEKPLSGTVGDIIAVAVIDLVSVLRPIPGGIESAQFRKPATARAQRFKEVVHTATDTRHGA